MMSAEMRTKTNNCCTVLLANQDAKFKFGVTDCEFQVTGCGPQILGQGCGLQFVI